jgi:C-terminal processing protease CtpA/Prc
MSGLELMTGANDFKAILIKDVRAGTPAAEAGLREGDMVVSINGRPASEFDLDKLSQMFRQSGKEYLLTVRRDDQVISARLRLKRMV